MGFELTWLSLEKREKLLHWRKAASGGFRLLLQVSDRAPSFLLFDQTQVALGRQNAGVFRANFQKGFAVVPPRKTIDGVCAVQRKSVRIRQGVPKLLETDGRFLLPFRPQ